MKILTLIFILTLSSCAKFTARPKEVSLKIDKSAVEIAYLMGHNYYRYKAFSKKDDFFAESYLNDILVEGQPIDDESYEAFVRAAYDYVSQHEPVTTGYKDCKSPYRITLKLEASEQVIRGCRHHDSEGRVGKLIRQGELLLYSKEIKRD